MAGTLYARYNYDAWGNTISITKLNGDAILPSATEIAYLNPIRYRGYYFDQESGLYYLKSRYYDPQVKRFLNPDSIIFTPGVVNHNIFAYCNNNPVNMIDTDGYYSASLSDNPGTDDRYNYHQAKKEQAKKNDEGSGNDIGVGVETKTGVGAEDSTTYDFYFFEVTKSSYNYNISTGSSKTFTAYADPLKKKVGLKLKMDNVTLDTGTGMDGIYSSGISVKDGNVTHSFGFKEGVVKSTYTYSTASMNGSASYDVELNKFNVAGAAVAAYAGSLVTGIKELIRLFS